jgi:hypothetical protein
MSDGDLYSTVAAYVLKFSKHRYFLAEGIDENELIV